MTDNITEYNPDKVFELVEKLRFFLAAESHLYLNIGKLLIELTEKKRYKLYGSHIQTKADLLKELGLKRSTAYLYMDVYKTFGNILGDAPNVPYKRLVEALPVVKTREDAEKWIENAKNLLPGDYREEVYKAKTGVDALSCNHEDTETFLRCKRCHKWLKQ